MYVRADDRLQLLGDVEINLIITVSQSGLPPRDRARERSNTPVSSVRNPCHPGRGQDLLN